MFLHMLNQWICPVKISQNFQGNKIFKGLSNC